MNMKERIIAVRQELESNDAALEDAVVFIYDRQTNAEKSTQTTKEDNGVGFTGVDAELLSSFAEQILDRRSKKIQPGRCLSQPRHGREGQLGWARRKMLKYARQLIKGGWVYTGPVVRAANLPSDEQLPLDPSMDTTRRFESRQAALEDADRRIRAGRAWLDENRNDPRRPAAEEKLKRLIEYGAQLVTDSAPEDLRSEGFRNLAMAVKPCPACGGRGQRTTKRWVLGQLNETTHGTCYRCSGKGFQIAEDEIRNETYDRSRRA